MNVKEFKKCLKDILENEEYQNYEIVVDTQFYDAIGNVYVDDVNEEITLEIS